MRKAIREHGSVRVGRVRLYWKDEKALIRLPSGRDLCYLAPRVVKNRFGNDGIGYLASSANGKLVEQETFGGKLVENCLARGTLVLTDKGLVPIESIKASHLLWDGEAFVSHDGLIDKGIQAVICVDGLLMTENHRILSDKGWISCGQSDGLNWAKVALPEVKDCRLAVRKNDCFGVERKNRNRRNNSLVQAGSQLADRIVVHRAGFQAQVYDIRNCGPRHRFTVYDPVTGQFRIVSNCTQSVARDILAHAMLNLEAHGYRIVFHVHDECVMEMPAGVGSIEEACQIMSETPNWCSDLPLRADGYECASYRKS